MSIGLVIAKLVFMRDELIAKLREHRDELQRLGVVYLGLFGSVARDEAREDSDVDVLVEFADGGSFDAYMDLKFLLEDVLQRPVDLVTRPALKPGLQAYVERDLLDVA
jgi:uncharacterized protein